MGTVAEASPGSGTLTPMLLPRPPGRATAGRRQDAADLSGNRRGTLTQQDRILIVAQAIQMLDNFYVHRPLKEAIHAVRPIQRLRVLQRRLQQETNIPATRRTN